VEQTVERYIMAEDRGTVEIGDLPAANVGPGDVVIIPAGARQRITNTGSVDLIFYCVHSEFSACELSITGVRAEE